jgi:hypothetical protein
MVFPEMRRLAPLLLVAACGGGSTFTDAASGDDAPVPDASATEIDGAPADAHALCEQSAVGDFAVVATGATSRVIAVPISNDPTATDGDIGTIDLAFQDIQPVSGFGWVGVDGTSMYALTPPDTVGGAYTHTTMGAAPGITALFADSINGLFGAGGMTLYRITPSPYAMTAAATVTTAGCTAIADFGLEISGSALIYDLILDCAGGDRYEQLIDNAGDGNLTVLQGPGAAGPTDMEGFTEFNRAVSSEGLYDIQGAAFVEIRPLSPCLGLAAGSLRGMQ